MGHTDNIFPESIEMLCNLFELNQKCAESDGATSTNTTSYTPESSSCKYEENNSEQSSFQSTSEDKGGQLNRFCAKTEKKLRELTTEDNIPNSCDGNQNRFAENVRISCKGLDVEIDFHSSDAIYQNEIGTLQLDYRFKIKAQEDYQFHLRNLKTNEETTYEKIIGEGSLFLEIPRSSFEYKKQFEGKPKHISTATGDTPQIPQTYIHDIPPNNEDLISVSDSKEELSSEYSESRSAKEDSCETLEIASQQDVLSVNSELNDKVSCGSIELTFKEEVYKEAFDSLAHGNVTCGKLCSNCNRVIEEENIYFCLFGHDCCKKCKGKPCILCQKMMGESKAYCKNHHKGCTIFSMPEHLVKHEIDCEFNNFRCPYPRCIFLNTLSDLKVHFLNSHNKNLIQSNNLLEVLNGRKDRKWYMYCYDSLFVCSYYYFGTHIEFIVQYIGANDRARFYHFEVEIKTMKERKYLKRAICAGWNDFSLCKGINFDYEDLTNQNSRFQFTANLKVVEVTNTL